MIERPTRSRIHFGFKETDGSTVTIPRMMFGLHLVVIGCTLLVEFGHDLQWYDREPVIGAAAVSVAVVLLVRPRLVLTPDGLEFVARIFFIASVCYASIDRDRILCIKVGWDREHTVSSTRRAVYSYRRPFVGIFLEHMWNDPPREIAMCIEKFKSKDVDVELTVPRKKAEEYARVLGCPVRAK